MRNLLDKMGISYDVGRNWVMFQYNTPRRYKWGSPGRIWLDPRMKYRLDLSSWYYIQRKYFDGSSSY